MQNDNKQQFPKWIPIINISSYTMREQLENENKLDVFWETIRKELFVKNDPECKKIGPNKY